jgi:DNA helicase TIP49 (TBP-interacting protein)
MATYALCAIAESEVYAGELDRTIITVRAIRRLIGEITVLISEPQGRIPITTIREAGELLAEIEHRTQSIEATIGPSPDHLPA